MVSWRNIGSKWWGSGGRCINIQISAKVDAPGCVNAAGKLRQK